METIQGKRSYELGLEELKARLVGCDPVTLDLGTDDGRYVQHLAERYPHALAIGLDACRENLHERSRLKLPNLLFVIAGAHSLPFELRGLVSHITINFPWGSLLEGLLSCDAALMDGLCRVAGAAASLEVRLNGGALAEAGTTLESGTGRIHDNLVRSGWLVEIPRIMDAAMLRGFPTTWARRLAHGRDPRAVLLRACGPLRRTHVADGFESTPDYPAALPRSVPPHR